jgi:hypothetical protein
VWDPKSKTERERERESKVEQKGNKENYRGRELKESRWAGWGGYHAKSPRGEQINKITKDIYSQIRQ